MRRYLPYFSFFAVLVSIAACGSSDGGSGSATSGTWQPTAEDEAFMEAFCKAIQPCCASNARTTNPDSCKASLRKRGFSRDASLTSQCLSEMQALASAADCVPDLADRDDPCVRAFQEPGGPTAPGKPCKANADCSGRARALTDCTAAPTPSDLNAPSVCVVKTLGKADDSPCVGTIFPNGITLEYGVVLSGTDSPLASGFLCARAEGLYCDPSSRACKALVQGGGACSTFEDACASRVCQSDGTCRRIVAAGQSCEAAVCDEASYCDPTMQTCTDKLAEGTACVTGTQCTGSCKMGACSSTTGAQGLALLGWCG
jgi:hypothetical protein